MVKIHRQVRKSTISWTSRLPVVTSRRWISQLWQWPRCRNTSMEVNNQSDILAPLCSNVHTPQVIGWSHIDGWDKRQALSINCYSLASSAGCMPPSASHPCRQPRFSTANKNVWYVSEIVCRWQWTNPACASHLLLEWCRGVASGQECLSIAHPPPWHHSATRL